MAMRCKLRRRHQWNHRQGTRQVMRGRFHVILDRIQSDRRQRETESSSVQSVTRGESRNMNGERTGGSLFMPVGPVLILGSTQLDLDPVEFQLQQLLSRHDL